MLRRYLLAAMIPLAATIPLAALAPASCSPEGNVQQGVEPSPGAEQPLAGAGARAPDVTTTAGPFEITVTPWGPDDATVARMAEGLLQQPEVQRVLSGAQHRLLSFRVMDAEGREKEEERPPTGFEATIYDYTNERTLVVTGNFGRPEQIEVTLYGFEPPPTDEEFAEAVRILSAERSLSPALRAEGVVPYLAMPGALEEEAPDGSRRRVITVGFASTRGARLREAGGAHEMVGVRLATREVVRLGEGLRAALEGAQVCDPPPDAGQPTTPRYTAGQYRVSIRREGQALWTFLAVRPSASSGTRGSGVELRNVRYKGVEVLSRAHAPILNVHYSGDACGPYRDWQYEEGRFEATGEDVAPGFRVTRAPARTILESGSDRGDFDGVALYAEGQEAVLVSEMEAGWYRYISQWRLHEDGTIKPQFGFAGISNPCTCRTHFHNVYWRLDFDVDGAEGDRIEELNSPPGGGPDVATTMRYETKRPRDPARQRRWRIADAVRAYTLIPGANDGTADDYARGDLWLLRFQQGQIDDGNNSTGSRTEAELDRFDNDESLVSQDVVVWYSAHFEHRGSAGLEASHQIVGPTLVPSGF